MSDEEPTDKDAKLFDAVLSGKMDPDLLFYTMGWKDAEAGKQFHEGPTPYFGIAALSWRIGWNDYALKHNKDA